MSRFKFIMFFFILPTFLFLEMLSNVENSNKKDFAKTAV